MVTEEIADQSDMETFQFTGHRGPFCKLLLINLFLTVITLGIYRFWAKTNVRRFIWSNIRFMGDPLEYTGKASELLLGFLIVIAILFPLGLVYNLIQFLVPPDYFYLHVGLEVLYYLVLFALIQVGFYRAWRYRMSRTTWRGIRLGLDGSTWTFLKISVGWTVLTILTLGIAFPWMAVELWRYQITHTRVGTTVTSFNGMGRDMLPSWLIVMAPMWAIIIGFGSYFLFFFDAAALDVAAANADQQSTKVVLVNLFAPWVFLLTRFAYLITLIAWFWFNLDLARYQISGMSLGEATIISRLPFGRLLAFAALAICVFAVPAGIFGMLFTFEPGTGGKEFIVILIAAMFATFILLPIAWTLIFTFELVKQLFITATITNPAALGKVMQSAAETQKTGEGLADALDIGGL